MTKVEKAAINKKFQNDKWEVQPIKNNILVCRDCKNRYDDVGVPSNTSKCEKFQVCKPIQVLGGSNCDEYIPERTKWS